MSKRDHLMVIACMGVVFVGFAFLANYVGARSDENERRAKASCVERGGKVIEHAGGLTRYSCEGPTRF